MADERKIVIVLKAENASSVSQTQEPEKVKTGAEETESSTSSSVAIAAFAAKEIISTTISEITDWAMYEWDKNLMLEDDYVGQRNKNIAMQCISKVGGAANTVFNTTIAGATIGGPWGAAIGAAIGIAKVASSTIRDNVQHQQMQDIQLAQMNMQLSYTRNRIGWSTNAASIGEDL